MNGSARVHARRVLKKRDGTVQQAGMIEADTLSFLFSFEWVGAGGIDTPHPVSLNTHIEGSACFRSFLVACVPASRGADGNTKRRQEENNSRTTRK